MLTVSFDHVWVRFAYDSVCGRVLLAHMSRDALNSYIAAHPIARARDKDTRTKSGLLAMVEEIREQGYYAYSRDNGTVFAVASPVFDAKRDAVAAVGVPVPSVRVTATSQKSVIDAVRETARQISLDLGWHDAAGV